MKNNSKRICALLLAIVMCIGCVVPVFAETTVAPHDHSAAAEAKCPGYEADGKTPKEHTTANSTYAPVLGDDGKPVVVAPQCGEWGYTLNRCTTCNAPVLTDWVPPLGGSEHPWGEWTVDKAPTCFEYGVMYRECTTDGCPGRVEINANNYAEMTAKYGADVTKAIKPREHKDANGNPTLANDKPAGLTCQDTATWNVWCTYEDCTHGKLASGEVDTAWNDGIDGKVEGKPCVREVVDITLAPDCYSNGKATVKCSVCGDTDTEVVVEATQGGAGHSWVKLSITTPATCAKAASGTAKCTVCGKTADVVEGVVTIAASVAGTTADVKIVVAGFEKLAHDFSGEQVKEDPATCEKEGTKAHYVCKNGCGATSLDGKVACTAADLVISKAAHKWGAEVPKVDYTCTVDGKKAHKICSVCEAILDVEASAKAGKEVIVEESALTLPAKHEYDIELDKDGKPIGEPLAKAEPTCTKFGFWFYGCTICGMPATDTNVNTNLPVDQAGFVSAGVYRIPMKPHDTITTTVTGSCTDPTIVKEECKDCDWEEVTTTAAPGHAWKKVAIAATCQNDGYSFDYCTVCGFNATDNKDEIIEIGECVTVRIETTAEAAGDRPVTDAEGKYDKSEKDPDNHEWDEMQTVVTTPAKCDAKGRAVKYCPWCDKYQNVDLPELGHKVDYADAGFVKEVLPKCGVAGYYVYECSVCGDDSTQVNIAAHDLPTTHAKYSATAHQALEHKFVYDSTAPGYVPPVHTKPTCNTIGFDTYTCVNGQGCTATEVVSLKDGNPIYPKFDHVYPSDYSDATLAGKTAIFRDEILPVCKPEVVDGVLHLVGINGYVVDRCALCEAEKANNANYRTDYPITITYEELLAAAKTQAEKDYAAKFLFYWQNADHHPGSYVNPDTKWHAGVEYADAAAADAAAVAAGATEADGIIRAGQCAISSLTDYYCPACGKTFHAVDDSMVGSHVAPSGHVDNSVAADCVNKGTLEHYTCTVCNKTVKVEIVNGEKVVSVYDITKDPTALEIPALDHDWVLKEGTDADCVNGGTKDYYDCSRCDLCTLDKDAATVKTFNVADVATETAIAPLGHKFGELVPEQKPGCTTTGFMAHYTCSECGKKFLSNTDKVSTDYKSDADLTIPVADHAWVEGKVVGKTLSTADCVTEGYRYDYCSVCDEEKVVNYVYPYGHKFGDIVNKVDPDCNDTGFEAYYECSECNKKFTSNSDLYSTDSKTDAQLTIPATDLHKNKGGETIRNTCTDTVTDRFCTGCNQTIAKEHANKKYNTVDATCTEYGYTAFDCIDCGEHGREPGTPVIEPTNPGHEKKDVPTYCYWDTTTKPAGMYTPGEKYLKCNVCDTILETVPTEPTGGIEFSYAIDNAIVSGAEYVNGGKIKLTIKYQAANIDLASIALRLNYDADVLTYVSGDFKCDAVDAEGNKIFDINDAKIGGKSAGYIVVTAKTFGFGEEPVDKKLDGEGIFAEIYFNINKNVDDGADIYFAVAKTGLSASQVLKSDSSTVYANFGAEDVNGYVVAEETVSLGDIDIDDNYTSADEIEFLDIAFSKNYVAAADINQDGMIGSDDYMLLQDLLLGNITYEEMCEAAQAVEPVA